MMNVLRLMFAVIGLICSLCGMANAQDGSTADASVIANHIAALQAARQAGLPGAIDSNSRIFRTINSLGKAEVSKQQAANELTEWLFVSEHESSPFASVTDRSLHPAANALISIGAEAVTPLKTKLNTITNDKNAILILRCLRQIYRTDYSTQLLQLKSQSNSVVVTHAIDYVLGEQREPRGVTLEPEN